MEHNMFKFCFIILHYQNIDDTLECVYSFNKLTYKCYELVIVDNDSPNGTGEKLKEIFKKCSNVHVVLNKVNVGYARGNNIGYEFARKRLNSDFAVVVNNDTLIVQEDFCEQIIDIFNEKKFHVLGPDIINLQGQHQNPHRKNLFTQKDVRRVIRNRRIIMMYLQAKLKLGFLKNVRVIEKMEKQHAELETSICEYDNECEAVVLQGSCLIFSPMYIEKEVEVFCSETFMYFEEDILAYKCKIKKYIVRYSPDIRIIHKSEASTRYGKEQLEMDLFRTRNLLKSAKILRKVMRKRRL